VVSRNNVVAGLFVVGAMALAVAMSVAVSGVQKRLIATRPYTVEFDVADGAAGLQVGSPVLLGGQEVGRVTAIGFDPPGGVPERVAVSIVVRSTISLYEDAWVFLERPLLGSMSSINFARVGGRADPAHPERPAAKALADGGALHGTIAPPAFLAQAGFGPEQAKQVQKIFTDVEDAVGKLKTMTQKVDDQLEPSLKSFRTSLEDVNSLTADARKRWSEVWSGQVDSVLSKADKAADQLNATLGDADKLVQETRKTLDENRPALERSLTNIDQAMKRLNEEAVGKLADALDTGKAGAEEFKTLSHEARQVMQQEMPNVEKILGNFRLAADQIKLMSVELRRSPWRLLYSPKTKELEAELFYDAARTYAEAVSDLRAAGESLEAAAKAGSDGGPMTDRETLTHMGERLQEAFGRYKEAEKDLLKRMESKE
jgi:ABC-type transporter Mla subunit MlaD